MTQSVGEEQCMCSGCNGFIHIAFHQAQVFQALCQYFAHFLVNGHIGNARTGDFQRFVVASQYYIIYVFLATFEFSAYGNRAGMVRTIVGYSFGTGIGQHHAAYFQYMAVVVVVQCFSVLGQDGGK